MPKRASQSPSVYDALQMEFMSIERREESEIFGTKGKERIIRQIELRYRPQVVRKEFTTYPVEQVHRFRFSR